MVSDLAMARVGINQWRLTWSSDQPGTPIFRVYRDGLLIGTTRQRTWFLRTDPGEFPVLEVLDDAEGVPGRPYPSRMTIGWFSAPDVREYRVEQFLGGLWQTVKRVANEGDSYYRWTSGVLADATMHHFRILPVGVNGNLGTSIGLEAAMVRFPDPPQLSFAYDAGTNELTIAEL